MGVDRPPWQFPRTITRVGCVRSDYVANIDIWARLLRRHPTGEPRHPSPCRDIAVRAECRTSAAFQLLPRTFVPGLNGGSRRILTTRWSWSARHIQQTSRPRPPKQRWKCSKPPFRGHPSLFSAAAARSRFRHAGSRQATVAQNYDACPEIEARFQSWFSNCSCAAVFATSCSIS